MSNFAIAVHGGAGEDSEFIHANIAAYEQGLKDAVECGYEALKSGKSALDAVEAAVKELENNILFNSGRGSALNRKGEVEMDASIMDGSTCRSGAISMVTNVKNPVTLARYVMDKSPHVFLSGEGALEFAQKENLELETDSYFITDHQVDEFITNRKKWEYQGMMKKKMHGTVGAVALDKKGNVAAATSTGGTGYSLPGRIGDSCIIGAGCYANNKTCAVSGTGDGELLIDNVVAHSISMVKDLTGCTSQEACDNVVHVRNKKSEGDIGVVAVDTGGNISFAFNSERMHRAWKKKDEDAVALIY